MVVLLSGSAGCLGVGTGGWEGGGFSVRGWGWAGRGHLAAEGCQGVGHGAVVHGDGVAGRGGVDAREHRQERGLELAVGIVQRAPGLLGVGAGGLPEDADDAAAELGVRRDDVDHEVAPRAAEADHHGGRERVEDELLGGAGLEAGRAGQRLGPGAHGEQQVGVDGDLGVRVGGDEGCDGAELASPRESAGHERRTPGGREADGDVAGAQGLGLLATEVDVVLDVLDGLEQGAGAAGVVGHDEPGRGVEGGAQLGGVEHGEPSGRAGAEVVDGPAGAERLDRAVDEEGQVGEDLADGAGHRRVLGVEGPEDVEGGVRVDGRRPLVALLGGGVHGHLAAHPCEVSFLRRQRQCRK